MGKKWVLSSPNRSSEIGLESPAKSRPQLPSLSASFRRFSSLGWGCTLCQSPSSNSSLSLFRGPLCIYYLFCSCYSLWRLMFADLPVTRERKEVPTTMPPASLVSQCFHSVKKWRIKNCLRLCSALMTPEPCRAFDCATVSIQALRGGHPQVDWQCLFFFDVLVTFPRRTRGNDVWQKFYFWCFSSSEQYFLCLIKYVFWLAPFVFIILILTDIARRSDGTMWKRRAILCERAAV